MAKPALNAAFDYQNAKPMALPLSSRAPKTVLEALRDAVSPTQLFGFPGFSPGAVGTGKQRPIQLAPAKTILPATSGDGLTPEEFGTSSIPYTTSQVNASGDYTAQYYPFRAVGKLLFYIGASQSMCSASLIKNGIVVTAAHCVIKYGSGSGWYSNWTFVPAYNNGTAPYGSWTVNHARAVNTYINGNDACSNPGVVCQNDVAILVLNPNSKGQYPGPNTGYLGYGMNGYSYNSAGQALITQLGYPAALDGGVLMERNDSMGMTQASMAGNTVIGSLMTGGSSGGPWVVNLGTAPSLSGTSFGSFPSRNFAVGVTSWGSTSDAVKQMGASPFTSNNIGNLINAECATSHPWC